MIAEMWKTVPIGVENNDNERGIQVFTTSQLLGITGKDKHGSIIKGNFEQPFFYLGLDEREIIFKLCTPVFAVISGRMNRISAFDFNIVADKKYADRQYEALKNYYQIWKEYQGATDIKYRIVKAKMFGEILRILPDVLPDCSNFRMALMRWSKRINVVDEDKGEEIKEWLLSPNGNENWQSLCKKWIYNLMVHGALATYKEVQNGKIENIYELSGGTVVPLRGMYVGGVNAYVQIIQGLQPQIYYSDELSYASYLPSPAQSYGHIPLEALINKIAETMLFDQLMAEQADGSKPPEKMIIVADNSPFGDMKNEFKVPISEDEQKRIETKVNQPKKNAIMTFSGNTVQVVDLSRENTMAIQMERQKDVRSEVAMVFQASDIEVNLTGSENTSGRSTSEAQMELMHSKGVMPIVSLLQNMITKEILPYRYGHGWTFEFATGRTEDADIETIVKKAASGIFSINELREEMGLSNLGVEFDKPIQQTAPLSEQSMI